MGVMPRGYGEGAEKTARVRRGFAAAVLIVACAACGCGNHASSVAEPSPSPSLPVTRGDYPAFGFAADFSWIAGRIVRAAPAGQCTYVKYATRPGAPWGGRLAIVETPVADQFPDGDMVVVTGTLEDRLPTACGSPAYAVRTIEEH